MTTYKVGEGDKVVVDNVAVCFAPRQKLAMEGEKAQPRKQCAALPGNPLKCNEVLLGTIHCKSGPILHQVTQGHPSLQPACGPAPGAADAAGGGILPEGQPLDETAMVQPTAAWSLAVLFLDWIILSEGFAGSTGKLPQVWQETVVDPVALYIRL